MNSRMVELPLPFSRRERKGADKIGLDNALEANLDTPTYADANVGNPKTRSPADLGHPSMNISWRGDRSHRIEAPGRVLNAELGNPHQRRNALLSGYSGLDDCGSIPKTNACSEGR